ncbi:hypothetical protein [Streptacidiphilus sp. EB129]|jgi:hypothetical protein|uniref:hypothetical protein n=1 Tax=Streptacidiphilus sp. EB129 TaxID=3156262 RepID=UPI0035143D06
MATDSSQVIAVAPSALRSFATAVQTMADATGAGSLSEAKMKLKDVNNLTFAGRGLMPEADSLKSTITGYASTAATNIQAFTDGMDKLATDLIAFAARYTDADALAKASSQDMWSAVGPDLEAYFPGVVGAQPAPVVNPPTINV